MKRLRISHLVVQPVLVWDDGEELAPGPTIDPVTLPASELTGFADQLPVKVAELTEQLTTDQAAVES